METKIFSLTNPYKQLTIHNIAQINFPNPKKPETQKIQEIDTLEKRRKYKYQSTMQRFINEAVLQMDGIVSIQKEKYVHPKPKMKKPIYPKHIQIDVDKDEAEVVRSVQKGQQYSIKCFSDDLQEKYENHEIQTERPQKFYGRNRVFSLEHRRDSNLYKIILDNAPLTNQSISKYENDQSLLPQDSINNNTIISRSIQDYPINPFFGNIKPRDLIVKFKQNSIKIPAALGDPLFQDEQKLKQFREKYLLRERFNQRQQSQSPRLFQEVKVNPKSQLSKNESMFTDNNESVQIIIKEDSIQIHDPSLQQQVTLDNRSSQQLSEERKYKLNEQRKMQIELRKQNFKDKLLKDEMEQQRKKQEKIRIKQEKEEMRRKFLEEEEGKKLQMLINYRAERIKMIKIVKQMKERGESEKEIQAYKEYIDGLNPFNIPKDDEAEQRKREEQLKKEKLRRERQKRYRLHDLIFKRLSLKIKKSDHFDSESLINDSVERVKAFQKKLILQMRKNQDKQEMQRDFKLILMDIQQSMNVKNRQR